MKTLTCSKEKNRLKSDNTAELVAVIDKNGVMKYASSSHMSVLGYMPEYCEGKLVFDMVHPECLSDVLTRFIFMFETSQSTVIEFRAKHRTKGWVWLKTKASIISGEENSEGHLLIVSREIEKDIL